MMLVSIPHDNIIGKLLKISPKAKKLKTTSRLMEDSSSGHLFIEIAHPSTQKDPSQDTATDYNMTEVDLGPPSKDKDVHNF